MKAKDKLTSGLTKGRIGVMSPLALRMDSSDLDPRDLISLHGSLGPPDSAPKRHLDRFICFRRAHGRDQQTDRQTDTHTQRHQTDHPRYSVCSNRLLSLSYAAVRFKTLLHDTIRYEIFTCSQKPMKSQLNARYQRWNKVRKNYLKNKTEVDGLHSAVLRARSTRNCTGGGQALKGPQAIGRSF